MQQSNRPLLALALAALLGTAPALLPAPALAQGKGHGHGKALGKSKGSKRLSPTVRAEGDVRYDRDGDRYDRDDDRYDDDAQPTRKGRRVGSRGVPPGQMPPAGMCRIWIDGVPPGRQPAATDCATAERTRPSNARVIYGSESGGTVARTRTIVRPDASCADVNGDGRRERVSYVVDGRVVRTVCR